MPTTISGVALTLVTLLGIGQGRADDGQTTQLKPFNVTVRVFNPAKGVASGHDYVLPVDSPDAEHAAASTMANAVSFTKKTDGGQALPVAFTCIKVEPR